MSNLADDYPAFGLNGTDEHTSLEVPYPERISRGLTIVRLLFGAFLCYPTTRINSLF